MGVDIICVIIGCGWWNYLFILLNIMKLYIDWGNFKFLKVIVVLEFMGLFYLLMECGLEGKVKINMLMFIFGILYDYILLMCFICWF